MSHNTLLEKINADVEAEVAKIKKASQVAVAAVARETEQQLEATRAAHQAALEKKLAQLELVAVSKAKQASKIALQTAKREEINSLFAEVAAELSEQDAAAYVALFTRYATKLIPAGVEITSVAAPAARAAETKEILTSFGFTGEITVDPQITAGFVLYAKDGVYDVTLARIINEVRAGLEMKVIEQVMA